MIQTLAIGVLGLGLVSAGVLYARSLSQTETPAYTVERAEGDVELRSYPELALAQVTRSGSRRAAVQSAFSPLARYIFARDRPGEKIAMTAPVVQEPQGEGWVVSFIMPEGMSLDALPVPTGDVRLVVEPARRMAAIRFSGAWTDARFAAARDRLLDWIGAQGLKPEGPAQYGYYDDPFTPAFLRRNEILVPIAP